LKECESFKVVGSERDATMKTPCLFSFLTVKPACVAYSFQLAYM